MYTAEAANGCVPQIICSTAAKNLKLDMMQKAKLLCKTVKIFTRKLGEKERGHIFHKFSCRTHPNITRLKRGELGQNLQHFSCRTHKNFPESLKRRIKMSNISEIFL